MKFEIEITVDVPTAEQAQKISEALQQIKNTLSDKDLIELAQLLKKRPGIVSIAKKFLGQ